MKNFTEIKDKSREQIMKILDMCGCYRFKEEHVDEWIEKWNIAKSPMIESIAEKSPYYDGKCKIVFPSEYPREINPFGIREFCKWLENYAERNLTEIKVNGYTLNEIVSLKNFYSQLGYVEFKNVNTELLFETMKDGVKTLLESYQTDEYYEHIRNLDSIYYNFRHNRNIKIHEGHAYNKEEYVNKGVEAALRLSYILNEKYAHTQLLTERLADELNYHFSQCSFKAGQKLSRAVNRIATKYNINGDAEWNKEFAKYADSINPLMVTKWTVISWDIVDYLTFCFGNSWSTCSNIDKRNVRGIKISSSRSSITSYVDEDYVFRGEHAAAALSYMFDKTSFVYYTVNHKYTGKEYEEQDKESRIMFSLNEEMDTLLQSRLYPQCNDDNPDDSNYRIPREIVQKVIADALETPNLWKMKKGSLVCKKYGISTGVHYADYTDSRNKNCNISWLGETPNVIHIGHNGICPNCGCTHTHLSSLNCEDCDPDYYY